MKNKQLLLAGLLTLACTVCYADCSGTDFFPMNEVLDQATPNEANYDLVSIENDDVPSEWIEM